MSDKDVIIAQQQQQIRILTEQNRLLTEQVAAMRILVEQLQAEIARLKKNSSNSSKPPSSDIVKPPKSASPRGKKRRRIGGQPGHPRQQREPFGPDDIDTIQTYTLESCPTCGGAVRPAKRPSRVLQQVEIPAIPLEITEHRGLAYWCPRCQKLHYAPLPDDVRRAGLVGPRLTALVAVAKRPPPRREAQTLAERFRKHGEAYFQFITTPGVEPTNNLAEQAIRFVVMDRHVTQGTRSLRGRQWCQRIWTAIATCRQQNRSVFDYLHQSITSHYQNNPTPSLLPILP